MHGTVDWRYISRIPVLKGTSVLVEPHAQENDHRESSNFSHFAKITVCGARFYEASFSADSIFEARPRSAILEK